MKRIALLATLVFLLLILIVAAGCTDNQTPASDSTDDVADSSQEEPVTEEGSVVDIDTLTVAAGVTTGSWYPIGAAISEIYARYGIKSNCEAGGGISNVVLVSDGDIDIGMTTSTIPTLAFSGEYPFEGVYDNIAGLCYIFDNFLHVFVADDSDIQSIPDLRGTTFSNQAVGTTTQMAFVNLLETYGMTEQDMTIQVGGQGEGADQVKDNIAVGVTALTAAPSGTFTELAISKPVRLLEFGDDVLEKMQAINSGYVKQILSANTYQGQTEDLEGIGSPLILIVAKDADEDTVYTMLKYLVDNIEVLQQSHSSMAELTVEKMADVQGIDLHPGAQKFWDEYFGN